MLLTFLKLINNSWEKLKWKSKSRCVQFWYVSRIRIRFSYTFQTLSFFIFYIKRGKPVSNCNKTLDSLEKTSTFYSIEDFNLYYLHCSSSLYTTSCGLCDALYRKSQIESQTDYTNIGKYLNSILANVLCLTPSSLPSRFSTVLICIGAAVCCRTTSSH